jgi:hypothetical protein
MRFQFFLAALALFATPCRAEQLSVESESLGAIPGDVASIVRLGPDAKTFRDCRLVGQVIRLQDKDGERTYFVTTADACGWGTAVAPIWLVHFFGARPAVILSFGAYGITINQSSRHQFRDLKLSWGTSSELHDATFWFSGGHYVLHKSKATRLSRD